MRRVNVLFLMPQIGTGTPERLVHSLIRDMDKNRFSPSLAWLYGAAALQEFRDLQVPLYFVSKTKRVDFSTMRMHAEIVKRDYIDVFNAQHFMPFSYAYYGCKLSSRNPLISTAHSRCEIEDTSLKWRVAGS